EEAISIVAIGAWDAEQEEFAAHDLLVKCPSKYQGVEDYETKSYSAGETQPAVDGYGDQGYGDQGYGDQSSAAPGYGDQGYGEPKAADEPAATLPMVTTAGAEG
ncbi:MAG: hypothetical protein AAFY88_28945, partial [Acidobacteriota bacterium]